MIIIRYHPELVEQAVWHAARREAGMEHQLHREVDPIYESAASEEREPQFQRIFSGWFVRLRLDQFVDEVLSHFSRIVQELGAGVVRPAPRRASEGAELFVPPQSAARDGTLVVQLCPESLMDTETARDGILRELQHVEDMLDPAFGYEREVIEGLPSHQQVTLERYRLLWDIRVERILTRQGLIARSRQAQLRRRFVRAFMLARMNPAVGFFDQLWEQDVGVHSELLRWSSDPRAWLGSLAGTASPRDRLNAGEPCPICKFPTFDWHPLGRATPPDLLRQARRARPGWDVRNGMCRQCAEALGSTALAV